MFKVIVALISAIIHYFLPARRYTLVGRLYGHRDSIHLLKATGTLGTSLTLASGGKDGVQLWKLPAMSRIPTPDPQHPRRGNVTALTWATDTRHATDILVFGTSLGFLVVWRRLDSAMGASDFQEIYSRSLGDGAEIISIDVDMSVNDTIRILNCSRDGSVQGWDFDEIGRISGVFSIRLDRVIPRAAQYATTQGGTRNALVLAYNAEEPGSGILVTLKAEDGRVVSTQHVAGSGEISSAAFCDARQLMAIDNGETGFDVCDINKCGLIRHFDLKTNAFNARLPTQVAFAEKGGVIVGGTDHGVAYVFDRRTGALVDTLYHALDGDTFVRTVSALDYKDTTYIFTANSSRSVNPYITIWKKDHDENVKPTAGFFQSIKSFFRKAFQVIMIISFAAFLSQNLGYYDRVRVLVHNMTADAPDPQGRVSYTTIDVSLVRTAASEARHDRTSYAEPNRERSVSAVNQDPIITEMDGEDDEDDGEDELQVLKLLEV